MLVYHDRRAADRARVSLAWTVGIISVTLIERTWTVRRGGRRGTLLAALILPEAFYAIWQGWLFFSAATATIQRREVAWGHISRGVTS